MPRVAPVTRARRPARRRELLMASPLTLRQPPWQEDPAYGSLLPPSLDLANRKGGASTRAKRRQQMRQPEASTGDEPHGFGASGFDLSISSLAILTASS